MLDTDPRRRLKVGLFTVGLLLLLGFAILALGRKQGLFIRHVAYETHFDDVAGLVPGAPVWLSGVVVGTVVDVALPSDPSVGNILVKFKINARLARHVRTDSRVRIRTLGLLGDRYLDLTSGDPAQPLIPPGGIVPGEERTDMAGMLAKSGDAVANLTAISSSLRTILERIEAGEGVLGRLTIDEAAGREAVDRLVSILTQADQILADARAGRSLLGRLVGDTAYGDRVATDLAATLDASRRFTEVLARDLQRDDSLVGTLLRDPRGSKALLDTLEGLRQTSTATAVIAHDLIEGKGTLGRLLEDEKLGEEFLTNLNAMSAALRSVAEKLDQGEGTAGRLINDTTIVEDLENVMRGVKESAVLRWFVRNRREAGENAAAEPTPRAGE